jgi:hypothetical protein
VAVTGAIRKGQASYSGERAIIVMECVYFPTCLKSNEISNSMPILSSVNQIFYLQVLVDLQQPVRRKDQIFGRTSKFGP